MAIAASMYMDTHKVHRYSACAYCVEGSRHRLAPLKRTTYGGDIDGGSFRHSWRWLRRPGPHVDD